MILPAAGALAPLHSCAAVIAAVVPLLRRCFAAAAPRVMQLSSLAGFTRFSWFHISGRIDKQLRCSAMQAALHMNRTQLHLRRPWELYANASSRRTRKECDLDAEERHRYL